MLLSWYHRTPHPARERCRLPPSHNQPHPKPRLMRRQCDMFSISSCEKMISAVVLNHDRRSDSTLFAATARIQIHKVNIAALVMPSGLERFWLILHNFFYSFPPACQLICNSRPLAWPALRIQAVAYTTLNRSIGFRICPRLPRKRRRSVLPGLFQTTGSLPVP